MVGPLPADQHVDAVGHPEQGRHEAGPSQDGRRPGPEHLRPVEAGVPHEVAAQRHAVAHHEPVREVLEEAAPAVRLAEPGAMRHDLREDPYPVEARQPRRDAEHGVERDHLALAEDGARRQPPQDGVQASEDKQEEDHIGEERDGGHIGPKQHALLPHDEVGVERNEQRPEQHGAHGDGRPALAGRRRRLVGDQRFFGEG